MYPHLDTNQNQQLFTATILVSGEEENPLKYYLLVIKVKSHKVESKKIYNPFVT
jgi:hypothetical protein